MGRANPTFRITRLVRTHDQLKLREFQKKKERKKSLPCKAYLKTFMFQPSWYQVEYVPYSVCQNSGAKIIVFIVPP